MFGTILAKMLFQDLRNWHNIQHKAMGYHYSSVLYPHTNVVNKICPRYGASHDGLLWTFVINILEDLKDDRLKKKLAYVKKLSMIY